MERETKLAVDVHQHGTWQSTAWAAHRVTRRMSRQERHSKTPPLHPPSPTHHLGADSGVARRKRDPEGCRRRVWAGVHTHPCAAWGSQAPPLALPSSSSPSDFPPGPWFSLCLVLRLSGPIQGNGRRPIGGTGSMGELLGFGRDKHEQNDDCGDGCNPAELPISPAAIPLAPPCPLARLRIRPCASVAGGSRIDHSRGTRTQSQSSPSFLTDRSMCASAVCIALQIHSLACCCAR